jgi:cysteine-rich repeat protein
MRPSALTLILSIGLLVPPATHAARTKSPTAVARSCQIAISRSLGRLARLGLREFARCEARKAASRTDRDCTVIRPKGSDGTTYRRWAHRADEIIHSRCPLDTTARISFAGARVITGATKIVVGEPALAIPSIGQTIEAGARDTQPAAPVQAAPIETGSSERDCIAAIASARTSVVSATMRSSLRCQLTRHGDALTTGPLAPDCQTSADDDVIRTAAGEIAGACSGSAAVRIGGCDALPQCALDAAIDTGIELARIAAGRCGNAVVDAGEECDDGNEDPTDECNQCLVPVCGNEILEGHEECDDGNQNDADGCSTDCRLAVCGDGMREGAEECDDGNEVALDGCTDCRSDPVPCSSTGVLANVTFDYNPDTFAKIAGIKVRLRYDTAALSMPGSVVGPMINQRVRNLTGATGVTFSVADLDQLPAEAPDGVDDTLQTLFASGTGFLPPGPFEQVRFDCVGADARVSQIVCSATEMSDVDLNRERYTDEVIAENTRCSITLEPAPVQ